MSETIPKDNLDEKVIEQHVKSMPTPSESAEKIINESEIKTEPVVTQQETFNEDIHSTDSEGRPVLNKDGSYRKKRGPRKRSGEFQDSGGISNNQLGKITSDIVFTLGIALGGDEWQPIQDKKLGIDEYRQMVEAWSTYYESTGRKDLPPYVVVIIAMASYSLPRFTKPKTRSRVASLINWIKNKVSKRGT